MNVDLQQRSVEFSQLFKSANNLRPALLEKMPPMQIQRVSNQNSDIIGENEPELLENGLDENENNNLMSKVPASDSVISSYNCLVKHSSQKLLIFITECIIRFTWRYGRSIHNHITHIRKIKFYSNKPISNEQSRFIRFTRWFRSNSTAGK